MTVSNKRKVLSEVSFITTVYNEGENIIEFLKSLMNQTAMPGEIIIVDGGSKDNTVKSTLDFFEEESSREGNDFNILLSDDGNKNKIRSDRQDGKPAIIVRVIKKNGANISQGRNTAIKGAAGRIICVSDAGCVIDRHWLEEITGLYNDASCNAVGGLNLPLCRNFLQKCLAVCIMPQKEEIDRKNYMPSSRNISFRKKIWMDAGGYPEDMEYGEDMKFDFNIKAAGCNIKFNPDAVVYWKMRENPVQISRQFFRYAKGDARGRMYLHRHLIRFFSFLALLAILLCAIFLSKWIFLMLIPLFMAYTYKAYCRLAKICMGKGNYRFNTDGKVLSVFIIPLILLQIDFSKMSGYIYGLLKK
ncbi:MAG: glycosyltransferase [Actinomycetota bacterium]|nr:glycosyltransferase [Actinomycetota bacterium]